MATNKSALSVIDQKGGNNFSRKNNRLIKQGLNRPDVNLEMTDKGPLLRTIQIKEDLRSQVEESVFLEMKLPQGKDKLFAKAALSAAERAGVTSRKVKRKVYQVMKKHGKIDSPAAISLLKKHR